MKLVPYFEGGKQVGYSHMCPGCGHHHNCLTELTTGGRPVWKFNGDMEKPSFLPSFRHSWPAVRDSEGRQLEAEKTICHYVLTDGVIIYQSDCAHTLVGQEVPLPELAA